MPGTVSHPYTPCIARLCISGYYGGVIRALGNALADTLCTFVLGLVGAATLAGFGMLCVVGAEAAEHYHHRVDQPRLTHVSCRWHDRRLPHQRIRSCAPPAWIDDED